MPPTGICTRPPVPHRDCEDVATIALDWHVAVHDTPDLLDEAAPSPSISSVSYLSTASALSGSSFDKNLNVHCQLLVTRGVIFCWTMSANMRILIAYAVDIVSYSSAVDLEMSFWDKNNKNMQHSGPQSTAFL